MNYTDRLIAIIASIIGSNMILSWSSWQAAKNVKRPALDCPNREQEEDFWFEYIEFTAAQAAAQARANFVLDNITTIAYGCTSEDIVRAALEVRLNIKCAWPKDPHNDLVPWARCMIRRMNSRTRWVSASRNPMIELEHVGDIVYNDALGHWNARNPRKKLEMHTVTGKPAIFTSPLDALDFLLKKRKSLPMPPLG